MLQYGACTRYLYMYVAAQNRQRPSTAQIASAEGRTPGGTFFRLCAVWISSRRGEGYEQAVRHPPVNWLGKCMGVCLGAAQNNQFRPFNRYSPPPLPPPTIEILVCFHSQFSRMLHQCASHSRNETRNDAGNAR